MVINSNGKIITMQIEDNVSANNAKDNMLKSLENRFREVYNCGFKDGYEIGLKCATDKIIEQIVEKMRSEVDK